LIGSRRSTEREAGLADLPLVGFLLFVVLSAAVPAMAAPDDHPMEPGAATVYRRPLGHDPATLDPARIKDIYSRSVSQQIFDGLVQFDRSLNIVPALAEFWKASRDGLTWTFVLRKGATFHHGREVTADDVVFSLTRLLDPRVKSGAADLFLGITGAQEFRAGRATHVAGLAAVDRHTVRVSLSEALTPFVSALAVGHAKIVPRDLVEREGERFGTQPVGSGPFRFVRWERGRAIVLAANRDHFEGPPRLSKVLFRIFPGNDADAMYQEFERGELEDAPPPTRDYGRAVASRSHVHVKRPMFSIRWYGLNTRVKPLDDRRVRQALIHAVDRVAVVQAVYASRHVLARGVLPPGTQGFNPTLQGYSYDPDKARKLLAEAGYPGGQGLRPIAIWSSVKRQEIVHQHEEVRKYWAAIGVASQIEYVTDWPTFARSLDEGKMPVFLHGWYADVPDPDNFLFKLFHSRSPQNFFGYANPAVDDLLVQARSERDIIRRIELYRKAEELVVADVPVIPILHHTYERLFQPYVRSVEVNGLGDPYIPLRKMWLERAR
jgi:peptide/nickel transport system substrate-binding protein/oligopeptide transport system substrate-binding protein